jgi:NitT/TauT family transport system substrate-binding protein/sulfonate transport system substrate-binding protein
VIVRTLFAAAAALLVAAAIGCGGGDSGGDDGKPLKIRMGWGIPAEEIKYVMMRHPDVAENLGKAYDVEWHQFSGTALGVQGLAAGTLDCASVGGLSVANGIDRGADIVVLGEFIEERRPFHTTAWMVRKDSGIDSLADLRGKTVATNAVGGSTDYLQDFYIEQRAGLKPGRDYKKVEVPFGQMQEALLSGRIDVGLFPQPFFGAVNATGKVKPLFHVTDEIEPFVQIMNGCRRDFVEHNRAAMRAFQDDWTRIARWMRAPGNRDEVIAASAAATKIPAAVLDRFLLTRQDYFRPASGGVSLQALQKEWDFFRARGGVKQHLNVSDHVIDGLLPPAG